jgi:hypothetical protein
MRTPCFVAFLAVAALAGGAGAQTPTQSVWQAASGLLPTQVCPAWALVDTASSDPVLAPTGLTISDTTGEDILYLQTDALDIVPAPDPIVLEARMRFVSGTSSASNRAPANIVITTAASTGTLLGIGADEIFLTGAGDVRAQTATVDTDGAAHTYRIEVTAAGAVTVFYDGVSTLTGSTYTSAAAFGSVRSVIWGEGSNAASGSHVWESVAHNLATCPSGTTSSTTTLPATTTIPTTTVTTTAPPPSTATPTTSSTSTSVPGGLTTTSTTTPRKTTTTSTTVPPPDCGDDVAPGTVNAVRCRLGILGNQIDDANGLGEFRSKLQKTLAQARGRVDEAASACDSGDKKTASRRMKQAAKFLQKMTHRLSGLSARKRLGAELRADLIQVIASIRADVSSLRKRPCGAS